MASGPPNIFLTESVILPRYLLLILAVSFLIKSFDTNCSVDVCCLTPEVTSPMVLISTHVYL